MHSSINWSHHAQALRFVGVDGIPGEQQFLGLGQSYAEWSDQERRSHPGADFRLAQHRPVRSDFDVAHLHQLTGPRQGVAVDGRDDWLGQVPNHQERIDVTLQVVSPNIGRRL